jgi:hypothetical protein
MDSHPISHLPYYKFLDYAAPDIIISILCVPLHAKKG